MQATSLRQSCLLTNSSWEELSLEASVNIYNSSSGWGMVNLISNFIRALMFVQASSSSLPHTNVFFLNKSWRGKLISFRLGRNLMKYSREHNLDWTSYKLDGLGQDKIEEAFFWLMNSSASWVFISNPSTMTLVVAILHLGGDILRFAFLMAKSCNSK